MPFRQLKTFSLLLVLWLALLQAIAPLVHAHPASSGNSVASGLHVHADESFVPDGYSLPVLKSQHHAAPVIGVASGVVPEYETLPATPSALLFVITLLVLTAVAGIWHKTSRPLQRHSPLLLSSAPRAPPVI